MMKKLIALLCCVVLMGSMNVVQAAEAVPMVEADTVGRYYYPACGGGVLISVDVTIDNNGKYTVQRAYATSLGEMEYNSTYNELFVVTYCNITQTSATGVYVELSGRLFHVHNVTGNEIDNGSYSYSNIFVSYT